MISSSLVAALAAADGVGPCTTTSASFDPGAAVLVFLGIVIVVPVSCSILLFVLPFLPMKCGNSCSIQQDLDSMYCLLPMAESRCKIHTTRAWVDYMHAFQCFEAVKVNGPLGRTQV